MEIKIIPRLSSRVNISLELCVLGLESRECIDCNEIVDQDVDDDSQPLTHTGQIIDLPVHITLWDRRPPFHHPTQQDLPPAGDHRSGEENDGSASYGHPQVACQLGGA